MISATSVSQVNIGLRSLRGPEGFLLELQLLLTPLADVKTNMGHKLYTRMRGQFASWGVPYNQLPQPTPF